MNMKRIENEFWGVATGCLQYETHIDVEISDIPERAGLICTGA